MQVLTIGNMYPPHHLGGYELTWRSSVNHLRGRGHAVRVLTTDHREARPDAGLADDPDARRELRWYWHDHRFPRLGVRARRRLEQHNLAVLDRHLREVDPDVVCWWGMGGMSMSLIERVSRRSIPAVGVVGEDWMVYGPRVDGWHRLFGRPRALARFAERVTGIPTRIDLDLAAMWLFNSDTTRAHARAAGWTLPRSSVAHPGVDPGLFPTAPVRPWRWRLAYVGRIDARKGIAVAIRAVSELPEATLTVLGTGDESHLEELRVLVASLDLGSRVEFARRPRAEVARVYADADAVLFPVLWDEPWGLVPLEAMAVGRPVVATGTGGSGEYLRDRENCVLYRPRNDPAALARAVRALAADGELRSRLRARGLQTARAFSEAKYNERIGETLEWAAGQR
jgi:glycogen synthase